MARRLLAYFAFFVACVVGFGALDLAAARDAPSDAAPGPPQLDGIVRIYTGGWTADTNGNGTCEDDAPTTYVATEIPQGKFRYEANGRRINAEGRYDLTVIIWAVDHTGTEMTRWNQETHLPGPTGNAEIAQGDQHYTIAWANSTRPAVGQPVTWFFEFKLHHKVPGQPFTVIDEFVCSVKVEAGEAPPPPTTTTTQPATTTTVAATTTTVSPTTTVAPTTTQAPTTTGPTTTATTMPPMNHDCPGMSYTPIGAIPPATPMFCTPLADAPATFVSSDNSWVDDFDHGASMAELGDGYRVFEPIDEVGRVETFRHNEHWMVDVEPEGDGSTKGGSFLRPDRSFRFIDGKLVVEMTVAAGIVEYDTDDVAWPEIAVSTADHPSTARNPTGTVPDEGYGSGHFTDATTVGIRLHGSRFAIMGQWNPDLSRSWELSGFQDEGGRFTRLGGYPDYAPTAWRTCEGTDPDTFCRDTFRWELTATSITLYVNGQLYMRHTGAGILPAELVDSDVYVYAISWVNQPDRVVRFHWDRVAVNPEAN